MGNMDIKYIVRISDEMISHHLYTYDKEILKKISKAEINNIYFKEINGLIHVIAYNKNFNYSCSNNIFVITYQDLIFYNFLILENYCSEIEISFEVKEYKFISNIDFQNVNNFKYIVDLKVEKSDLFVAVLYKDDTMKSQIRGNINIVNSDNNNSNVDFINFCINEYKNMFGKIRKNFKLQIITSPFFTIDGLSWPGIILVKKEVFNKKEIIAHEIAHQWFGQECNKKNFWLRESIADFCSNLIINKYYNKSFSSLIKIARDNYSAWLINNKDKDITSISYFKNSFEFECIVHGKVVILLHLLYFEIDNKIFKVLIDWKLGGDFWEILKKNLETDTYEKIIAQWAKGYYKLPKWNIEYNERFILINGIESFLHKPMIILKNIKNKTEFKFRLTENEYKIFLNNTKDYVIEGLLINNNDKFSIDGYINLSKFLLGQKKISLALRNINRALKIYKNNKKLLYFKEKILDYKKKEIKDKRGEERFI